MNGRHERLAELLQVVHRGMFEHTKAVLQAYGLPLTSMAVMRQVHQEPGITISEMARRTGIAKSYVSKTIESLEQQGYVQKRPDPLDQRLLRVYPTEQAELRVQRLQAAIRQRLAEIVAVVPAEQVDAIIEGLQILRSALDQEKRS